MRTASNVGRIVTILVIVVGLGILIGWWASRDASAPTIQPSQPVVVKPVKPVAKTNSEAQILAKAAEAEKPDSEPTPTWSDKLDTILLSDEDENKKADKILALMKEVPEEAQIELSQHLINMVQDENYAGTAQLLTNSLTASGVSSVLMNDLLNRNNSLKLPLLLEVARNDDHPLKGEAKEMLELFIQEEHGTNWNEWQTSVETWLKENPQ